MQPSKAPKIASQLSVESFELKLMEPAELWMMLSCDMLLMGPWHGLNEYNNSIPRMLLELTLLLDEGHGVLCHAKRAKFDSRTWNDYDSALKQLQVQSTASS